jgi:hypothetical protein
MRIRWAPPCFLLRASLLVLALYEPTSASRSATEIQPCIYNDYGLRLIAEELGIMNQTLWEELLGEPHTNKSENEDIHSDCMIIKLFSKFQRDIMVSFCIIIFLLNYYC